MFKHFLVLGATGPTGALFVTEALSAGHKITIYARTPSKLEPSITENKSVTTIQGDFSESAPVEKLANCGAEILVSFAGPAFSTKGTPIADFYARLLPTLFTKSPTLTNYLILSTPSYPSPSDASSWKWSATVSSLKFVNNSAYAEMSQIGQNVMSASTSAAGQGKKVTVFRVGMLSNGDRQEVEATFLGTGKDGFWISRRSIVAWVLKEAGEEKWVGQAPYICHK